MNHVIKYFLQIIFIRVPKKKNRNGGQVIFISYRAIIPLINSSEKEQSMLICKLIHPEIIGTLASCGHFSRILIADGNFPVATMSLTETKKVFLNLMPGIPTVTQVLEALVSAVIFQAAAVVAPPEDQFRTVHAEYRLLLPADIQWEEKERWAFYNDVKSADTALIIATGDTRRFANLLLTLGVRRF